MFSRKERPVAGDQTSSAVEDAVQRALNGDRISRDVIVIGTSAGGLVPLSRLLSDLGPGPPASVVVVLHRSAFAKSRLIEILGRRARMPVVEPEHGQAIRHGVVYVAPRDRHLLVHHGVACVTQGPREHGFRPAIDPLFRSAAASYGSRVVGVLLSGLGDDGSLGLGAIKRGGGLSLVQDPGEAEFPAMPFNAMRREDIDAVFRINEMADALSAIALGGMVTRPPSSDDRERATETARPRLGGATARPSSATSP